MSNLIRACKFNICRIRFVHGPLQLILSYLMLWNICYIFLCFWLTLNNVQNEISSFESLSFWFSPMDLLQLLCQNSWGEKVLLTYYSLLNTKTSFVCYSFSQLLVTHQKKHLLILMSCKAKVLEEQKEVCRVIYIINAIFFLVAKISLNPFFFSVAYILLHTRLCIGIATIITQVW